MSDNPTLNELLAKSRVWWDMATPEEKDAMLEAQRESYVRAEMSWPKPKFRWINGVKVYDSYEDYCND